MTMALASFLSLQISGFSTPHGILTSSSLHMVLMDPDIVTHPQRLTKRTYQIQKRRNKKNTNQNVAPEYLDNLLGDLETSSSSIPYTDETSSKLTNKNGNIQKSQMNNSRNNSRNGRQKRTTPPTYKSVSTTTNQGQKPSRNQELLKPISSVTNKKLRKKELQIKRPSRSSTMPGFAERSSTGRIRRFNDGLKVFEEKSGRSDVRKMLTKSEASAKGKQANAEAMYLTSASVPDSLVAFTSEIHRVSTHTFLQFQNDRKLEE